MRSIEKSHKTIEEAIEQGLSELGLSLEEVRVEVLEEGSRGLFGVFGAKPARVRLTERDPHADLDEEPREAPPVRPEPKAEPRPVAPPPKPPVAAKAAEPVRPAAPAMPAAPVESPPPRPAQPRRDAPRPPREREEHRERRHTAPRESIGPLQPGEADETLAFVGEVARLMGVEVEIETGEHDGTLCFDITGDEKGVLIGHRGETLDALQYLASLVKNKHGGDYRRVQVDAQGYRRKREETLVRLAQRIAERAYRSGRKVSLEPMNPYERRILHATLQDHEHVTTHSEGEEPNRRVVVVPK